MRSGLLLLLLISGLACGPARAEAIRVPNARPCLAAAGPGGKAVRARERLGESGYMAYASFDPDGWPVITYARAYFALPPVLQTFLSLHECGHLVLKTTNEFRANCYALSNGSWTEADLALIATRHRMIGRLGPQYGGSGAAFWAGTVKACPQYGE